MKATLVLSLAFLVASTASADGYEEHDYILNCSGCHRIDGTGSSAVPSLHRMKELVGEPGTRAYWVQVPGAAQAPLSNARLADLMNWLAKRFTGKAPDPPYDADEIARQRTQPLRDPLARRQEILRGR
jgi:mono/diheme cytochrome c family protein